MSALPKSGTWTYGGIKVCILDHDSQTGHFKYYPTPELLALPVEVQVAKVRLLLTDAWRRRIVIKNASPLTEEDRRCMVKALHALLEDVSKNYRESSKSNRAGSPRES